MSTRLSERADRMKAFSSAFTPFYASLSDEQKDVLRPLVHELAPGFGRGGHHGPRWAFGGWGPGGDGRHHGWQVVMMVRAGRACRTTVRRDDGGPAPSRA